MIVSRVSALIVSFHKGGVDLLLKVCLALPSFMLVLPSVAICNCCSLTSVNSVIGTAMLDGGFILSSLRPPGSQLAGAAHLNLVVRLVLFSVPGPTKLFLRIFTFVVSYWPRLIEFFWCSEPLGWK